MSSLSPAEVGRGGPFSNGEKDKPDLVRAAKRGARYDIVHQEKKSGPEAIWGKIKKE